jgi:hypothetical protein
MQAGRQNSNTKGTKGRGERILSTNCTYYTNRKAQSKGHRAQGRGQEREQREMKRLSHWATNRQVKRKMPPVGKFNFLNDFKVLLLSDRGQRAKSKGQRAEGKEQEKERCHRFTG